MVEQIYLNYKEEFNSREDENKKLLGIFFDESWYDKVIDFDCDIYKPEGIDGERELLATFRKNVFSDDITSNAYEGVIDAIGLTDNRGYAAGPITLEDNENMGEGERKFYFGEDEDPDKKLFTRYVIRKDGSVSDTSYGKKVEAAIAGYFDRYVRFPFCRQTSYTRDYFNKFSKAIPFFQEISNQFEELVPDRWKKQKNIVDSTESDFIIPKTVFTTITLNKNFRTAGHRDAGDYKPGFGNLTVLNNNIPHENGYLIFPKYRVAVDVQRGDFLGMDVHEIHGNSSIAGPENYERVSVVCYYREKMHSCNVKQHEDLRKDFYYEYGYKPKMYHSPEWEFTIEEGKVTKGMFDSIEYKEWFKNRLGSIDSFL